MVAVLSEDINREQFWGSGEGSLSCPSCLRGGDEMKCIYMTVTGAEVWHQRVSTRQCFSVSLHSANIWNRII